MIWGREGDRVKSVYIQPCVRAYACVCVVGVVGELGAFECTPIRTYKGVVVLNYGKIKPLLCRCRQHHMVIDRLIHKKKT